MIYLWSLMICLWTGWKGVLIILIINYLLYLGNISWLILLRPLIWRMLLRTLKWLIVLRTLFAPILLTTLSSLNVWHCFGCMTQPLVIPMALLLFEIESNTDLCLKRHSCAFVLGSEEYTGPRPFFLFCLLCLLIVFLIFFYCSLVR